MSRFHQLLGGKTLRPVRSSRSTTCEPVGRSALVSGAPGSSGPEHAATRAALDARTRQARAGADIPNPPRAIATHVLNTRFATAVPARRNPGPGLAFAARRAAKSTPRPP